MSDYSKYNVPPFEVDTTIPTTYTWWSWHPTSFDKWTKSCWKGSTIEEAVEAIKYSPEIYGDDVHKLDCCHNKLIKHSSDGYEEAMDLPCRKTDLWDKCIARDNKRLT